MTSSNQINEGVPYSRFFSNERYIAYIPLLATAVALAYDVGFFYAIEISFFTLFSLSEHILFALQALPLVFVILFGVTFALGMLYFNRYRPQRAPPSVESSPGAKIIGTVVGVVMIVILILVLIYLIRRLLLGSPEAGLFVVIVIPLYFMLLIVETQFRPLYYLLFAVNVCLVFSFTVGYWYGKAYFSPNAQEHLRADPGSC